MQLVCAQCTNIVGSTDGTTVIDKKCKQCGFANANTQLTPPASAPAPKGEQYNPNGNYNDNRVTPNTQVGSYTGASTSAPFNLKSAKKMSLEDKIKKQKEERLEDAIVFESEEISQCRNSKE